MPHVDWSIDLGGIVMVLIAAVFIPITRTLVVALWAMRDTVRDISHIVVGTTDNDSTALVTRMKTAEHAIRGHRDRLINIEADAGLKIQDRS